MSNKIRKLSDRLSKLASDLESASFDIEEEVGSDWREAGIWDSQLSTKATAKLAENLAMSWALSPCLEECAKLFVEKWTDSPSESDWVDLRNALIDHLKECHAARGLKYQLSMWTRGYKIRAANRIFNDLARSAIWSALSYVEAEFIWEMKAPDWVTYEDKYEAKFENKKGGEFPRGGLIGD